jgi:hypothetical protein
MNRNGTTSELLSLGIFDDTSDGLLTLYSSLCDSASLFTPSKTVLLISNPGWRIEKTAKLTLSGNSRVDIDPDMGDARRLRALAQRLTKKEHVNPPFPITKTLVEGFENTIVKPLYTLADVDDFARSLSNANSKETIAGYLSVIVTELNIVTPFKRNMLMSNECCGIPIFANSVSVKCKQCEKTIALRINPRIVSSSSSYSSSPSLLLRLCILSPSIPSTNTSPARPHPRRNRTNQFWKTHPLRHRLDATPRPQRGTTNLYQSRYPAVSRAAAPLPTRHHGLCDES